jgi:hypothetical protein
MSKPPKTPVCECTVNILAPEEDGGPCESELIKCPLCLAAPELLEALKTHGRHTSQCDFENERGDCTCGFGLGRYHPSVKKSEQGMKFTDGKQGKK